MAEFCSTNANFFLKSKMDLAHLSNANQPVHSWTSRMLAMYVEGNVGILLRSVICTALANTYTHCHINFPLGCSGNSSNTTWSLHALGQVTQMLAYTTCHSRQGWIHMPLKEQFVIVSLVGSQQRYVGHYLFCEEERWEKDFLIFSPIS